MKINVSEIENKESKSQNIKFSEIFEEFNSEIPVNADLNAEIIGDLIKIKGKIQAVLKLTCDVCLKEFTKEINIDVEEYYNKYSLNDSDSGDFEIKEDAFTEDLNGQDEIDITNFVYQSIILSMPNKIVCDINCNGDENIKKYIKTEISDPRLEIFKKIKIEKE